MANNQSGENQQPNVQQGMLNHLNVGRDLNVENATQNIYQAPPVQRPRLEKCLLQAVKEEVDARIAYSLHNAVLINLGKEVQPEQVRCPWSSDIKIGYNKRFGIPDDTNILKIFDQEEVAGKLLILGNPGAGKTTTMLDLAKALIARAEKNVDYPIPVLFNLSTWKDDKQSIQDWLVTELKSKYGTRKDIATKWVSDAKLLPMLDGLDELAPVRQQPCVRKINEFLQSDCCRPQYLVVCSRYEEYETIVRGQWQQDDKLESGNIPVIQAIHLHLNGAIFIKEPTDEQIKKYLDDLNKSEIWETLQLDFELLNLVRTPLFLNILGFISFPKLSSIQELKEFTLNQEYLKYMLDSYWETAIKRNLIAPKKELKGFKSDTYGRNNFPNKKRNREWLIYLAQQLQRESQTEFTIETMQPQWLDSSQLSKYMSGLKIAFFIITAPLGFLFIGTIFNVVIILLLNIIVTIFTICINFLLHTSLSYPIIKTNVWGYWTVNLISFWISGKIYYRRFIPIILEKRWSNERQQKILPIESLNFSLKPCWSKAQQTGESFYDLFKTPRLTITIILISIFFHCWEPKYPVNFKSVTYPNKLMRESFINSIKLSAFTSIAFSSFFLFFTLLVGLLSKPIAISFDKLLIYFICSVLLFSLLIAPAVVVMSESGFACIQHFILRLILWRKGSIPWNYARFLNYCTERVLLQRVGGRYRFIHRLVQEHFAAMPLEK